MYQWDDANVDHVAEHDVEPWEAEQALADPRRVRTTAYNAATERRQGYIGVTEDGRVLTVIYTVRGNRIRIVTARDASDAEYDRYVKGRK